MFSHVEKCGLLTLNAIVTMHSTEHKTESCTTFAFFMTLFITKYSKHIPYQNPVCHM